MITEKIPLPLPLDIKDASDAGPSDGLTLGAVGLEACEVLGLPPPPAYDDVPLLSGRSIFRRRTTRTSRIGRSRPSIRTNRAKDLPDVPPDVNNSASDNGSDPGDTVEEENEEEEENDEEEEEEEMVVEEKKISPIDRKCRPVLSGYDSETPSASSSNVGLSMSSPTSITSASSYNITGPIRSTFSIPPRPSVSKKGSAKSSYTVTSEQRSEVRSTVIGFVRDLVTNVASARLSANDLNTSREVSRGILASCSNACRAHNVHFGRLLQARCISEHTPLYWAIVNRQPRPFDVDGQHFYMDETSAAARTADDELLYALLAYAGALSPHSMDDLRHACLVSADNVLLQRLRATPAVNPLAGSEVMILFGNQSSGVGSLASGKGIVIDGIPGSMDRYRTDPTFGDCAVVREGRAGGQASENAFRVEVDIDMFQRRMRVVGEIAVEFVARGRLWTLCFFVVKSPSATTAATLPVVTAQSKGKKKSDTPSSLLSTPSHIPASARLAAKALKIPEGVWVAALALLPHSAPCGVDARIIIADPALSYGRSSSSLPSPMSASQVTLPGHNRSESGSSQYLSPPGLSSHMRSSSSSQLRDSYRSPPSPVPMHPQQAQSYSVRSRAPSSSSSIPFVERFIPRTNSRTATKPPLTLRLNHIRASCNMLVAPSPPSAGASGPMVTADKITNGSSLVVDNANEDDSEWEYEYTPDAPGGVRRRTAKSIRRERKAAKKAAKNVGKAVKRMEKEREKATTANKEVKVKTTKTEKALAETVVLASLDENWVGNGNGKKKVGKGHVTPFGAGGFLMYDNCEYIAPDGTLRLVLEAQLRGPNSGNGNADGGCIIC